MTTPLFFTREVQLPTKHKLTYLHQDNAVMHVRMKGNPLKTAVREMFRGPQNKVDRSRYNSASAISPFDHNKYECGQHGVLMHFRRNKKITRTGKRTHADNWRSVVLFMRWVNEPEWPVWFDTNNMVLDGKFTVPIPVERLKRHRLANYSEDFPGISLRLEGTKCTAVFYPKRSKFIITGVTQANDIHKGLDFIHEVLFKDDDHQSVE